MKAAALMSSEIIYKEEVVNLLVPLELFSATECKCTITFI